MSVSITRWAIPEVANSPWPVIDEHLQAQDGDWPLLRGLLINAVAGRAGNETGIPVSTLERLLIADFYRHPGALVTFLDVLALIRSELAAWPAPVLTLAKTLLGQTASWEPVELLTFRCAAAEVARQETRLAEDLVQNRERQGRCHP
jgi:hypothetical protein